MNARAYPGVRRTLLNLLIGKHRVATMLTAASVSHIVSPRSDHCAAPVAATVATPLSFPMLVPVLVRVRFTVTSEKRRPLRQTPARVTPTCRRGLLLLSPARLAADGESNGWKACCCSQYV